MFGHLKAEEFTNLLEGVALSQKRQAHFATCAHCASKLESVQRIQSRMSEVTMASDEFIPEPDWSDFRGDVRNALLSRSVQRETADRRWFGWSSSNLRPAMAWSLSVMFVLGLTLGLAVWQGPDVERTRTPADQVFEPLESSEVLGVHELSNFTNTDAFGELVRLNAAETESLLKLLEESTRKGSLQ